MVKNPSTRITVLLLACLAGFLIFRQNSPGIAATPCPPGIGSNLGGNWDESNLEFLRESANCDGPIDVNIIITAGDLTDVDPNTGQTRIQTIQTLTDEYNLNVVYRLWGNPLDYDPVQHPELLTGLALLNGEAVFFGNEQNYCTAEDCPGPDGNPDPTTVARVYRDLLNAGLDINIVLLPLNMQNPTQEKMLEWRTFMDTFVQTCPECLASVDFAAINAYTPSTDPGSVDAWVNQVETYYQYLQEHGFQGRLIVAEAGVNPGAYQNFDQRVQATIDFAKALENRMAVDQQLQMMIDRITFFLMDDSTGKQYMIYRSCDANGVCTWNVVEYLTYNQYIPGLITPTPPPFSLTCSAADAPPGPFRPAPCEDCGGAIRYPVNTCATSFTVSQDTHFYFVDKDTTQGYWDPEASEVILCDEGSPYAYFDRDWGGWITIDTDKTLVPFAGYHDKLENQEAKYLAQYFTGSLVGVGPKYPVDSNNFFIQQHREAGVMSKILPPEMLDDLRCQRIELAMADDNENYRIPFDDNSNLPTAKRLSEFNPAANRVPCFRPQVPYQQNPALWRQWDNDMVAWLQTDYAKLWPYIPLTTLKDAPGSLTLTVQSAPGRLVNNYARLSFPHLGSLYESSLILREWLTPQFDPGAIWPSTGSLPAATQTTAQSTDIQLKKELAKSSSYCGLKQEISSLLKTPKTVLAQTNTSPDTWYNFQINPGLVPLGDGAYQSNWVVTILRNEDYVTPDGQHQADAFDASHVQLEITIQGTTTSTIPTGDLNGARNVAGGNNTFAYNYGNMTSLMVQAAPGTQVTFTVRVVTAGGYNMAQEDPYKLDGVTVTVSCTVNADGTIDQASCTPTAPVLTPSNTCTNSDSYTPSACNKIDALSDINPNDVICSSPYPIKVQLVVDGYKVPLTQGQFEEIREAVSACIDHCHENHIGGGCDADCYWQPLSDYTSLMSRDIGVNLIQIPYLERIGIFTTRNDNIRPGGVFDIFRPSSMGEYAYKEAKSDIGYSYQGTNSYSPKKQQTPHNDTSGWLRDNAEASPDSGDFYYPWLGGVEMAKQCVSKVYLQPDISVDQVVASEYCPKLQ